MSDPGPAACGSVKKYMRCYNRQILPGQVFPAQLLAEYWRIVSTGIDFTGLP